MFREVADGFLLDFEWLELCEVVGLFSDWDHSSTAFKPEFLYGTVRPTAAGIVDMFCCTNDGKAVRPPAEPCCLIEGRRGVHLTEDSMQP